MSMKRHISRLQLPRQFSQSHVNERIALHQGQNLRDDTYMAATVSAGFDPLPERKIPHRQPQPVHHHHPSPMSQPQRSNYAPLQMPFQSPSKSIQGNASPKAKEKCLRQLHVVTGVDALSPNQRFGHSVATKLRLVSVDTGRNAEEPSKTETKVVCEIKVEANMANALETMHGGCIALLVDDCTYLPFVVMAHELNQDTGIFVSQNINISYHAPAMMNSELRIVSTLVSYGSRVGTSRCEIWDKTKHRLIATGIQTMMQPSPKTT